MHASFAAPATDTELQVRPLNWVAPDSELEVNKLAPDEPHADNVIESSRATETCKAMNKQEGPVRF